MQLSIIIVNYNVKRFLEQCLLSVEKAISNLDAEVIVVDNASTDGSELYFDDKFPSVKFIWNTHNSGFSCANNQGIRLAKGEYVLLLNPDTIIGENTLVNVLKFMDEHPQSGGVGVKMIDRNGSFLPESKRSLPTPWNSFSKMFGLASVFPKSAFFGKYRLLYLNENSIHAVDVLSGAFMMLRAQALLKSGLLDETFFMYGEDIDLSYRLLKAGYQNYYLPETIVHYKGESTKKGSLKYVQTFYGAMLIFYKKNYPRHHAYFALLVKLAVVLHSLVVFLKNFFSQNIVAKTSNSELLIPQNGESFSELIARVERK